MNAFISNVDRLKRRGRKRSERFRNEFYYRQNTCHRALHAHERGNGTQKRASHDTSETQKSRRVELLKRHRGIKNGTESTASKDNQKRAKD